ncbi:PA3496 family putative envelope integrity protein [Thalassolituus sp. LLYu03]|uniref:PA3496 family putative envelope integrity protein n=1 Tax=Thalassolituus sp. LLYu03 TaxID=3421656 RepID=UPI003D285434
MSQPKDYDDFDEFEDHPQSRTKQRGRTADYDKKRRRAERILEEARLRDLLGFDIDYQD